MRKSRAGRTTKLWTILGAGLALALALATPALAQGDAEDLTDDDQIVLNGRLTVGEGETVGAAVIFNGPASVAGTVSEALVVFNGNVEITGTVQRDVMVFNGDVVVRDGAEIGGNLVTQGTATVESGATVSGEQRSIARADWGDVGLAGRFAWWIAYSISTLALGMILLLLAPGLDRSIQYSVRDRMGASIGIGLAAFILLPIVAVILLATIVGIPLGLFLLLGLALLYTIGYVAGAHAIGRLIVKEPKSRYVAFLAGWVILRLLGLIPFVGGLVWMLATILGLGVILTAARNAPRETQAMRTPPPPAPVPAVG